jgi:hypothetical protein
MSKKKLTYQHKKVYELILSSFFQKSIRKKFLTPLCFEFDFSRPIAEFLISSLIPSNKLFLYENKPQVQRVDYDIFCTNPAIINEGIKPGIGNNVQINISINEVAPLCINESVKYHNQQIKLYINI